MNFSEFKKALGIEPRSRDPEFLAARESTPEFREAAREAERFEGKLQAAFSIGMPPDLLERISRVPELAANEPKARSGHAWRWLAAAAVVVAGVGFASISWYESTFEWESVDDFLVEHWNADGAQFLGLADGQPVAQRDVNSLFAGYDIVVSPALAERIDTLGNCKTPGGRGAHMVVITDEGPVTLIFMPEVDEVDGHILAFDNLVAATLKLERGSAVIIGLNEEMIAPVYALARSGIRPNSGTS